MADSIPSTCGLLLVLISLRECKSRGFVSVEQKSDGKVELRSAGTVRAARPFLSSCGVSVHPADQDRSGAGVPVPSRNHVNIGWYHREVCLYHCLIKSLNAAVSKHMMGVGGTAQEAMEEMRQAMMSPQGNTGGASSSSGHPGKQCGILGAAEWPPASASPVSPAPRAHLQRPR